MSQFEYVELSKGVLDGWRGATGSNRKAVVFVHGFLGSSLKTWRNEEADLSFPELIISDPQFEDFDAFRFQYVTRLFRGPNVNHIARQLEIEMATSLADYQVVLLGHSMGGLVAMEYIVHSLSQHKDPRVLGLLMYGTPTTGVELIRTVRLALSFAGLLGSVLGFLLTAAPWLLSKHKQISNLEAACEFLDRLHGEWVKRVLNGGDPATEPEGRAWIPVRVVTGNEDWVVEERSAKGLYGEIDWSPLDFDHRALAKPCGRNDLRYKRAAEFLERCRYEKPPAILARLHEFSEQVWRLRDKPLIRNWEFEIHFHAPGESVTAGLLEEFAVVEVRRCRYRLLLRDRSLTVAMALGRFALDTLKPRNPVYIHGIRTDAMSESEKQSVADAIQGGLAADAEQAWRCFFAGVRLRITDDGGRSFALAAGEKEPGNGYLATAFPIPPEANDLLGKEVTLDLGFKTIRPAGLSTFTVAFPWITAGCNVQVVIHGRLDFLTHSPHFVGDTGAKIEAESHGRFHTVQIKTDDIVLPHSSVRIQWRPATGEDDL